MINFLKYCLIFIFFTTLGITIFILSFIYLNHENVSTSNPLIPKTYFSLKNAPAQSLKGEIASLSGNVAWASRTAAVATLIDKKITVGQGEEIIAQGNGAASVIFPYGINIDMSSNSDLLIIQTLPINLVFSQTQGTITYKNQEGKIPMSIKPLDLLIEIKNGTSSVTVDKDKSQITLNVSSGSATIAFTDTNNNTVTETIKKNSKILFDNDTKTFRNL